MMGPVVPAVPPEDDDQSYNGNDCGLLWEGWSCQVDLHQLVQRPIGSLIHAMIGGAQPFSWLMGPRRVAL